MGFEEMKTIDVRTVDPETLVDVTNVHCAPGDTVVFDIEPLLARGMKKEYR